MSMKSDKTPQIDEHIVILHHRWIVLIKIAQCDPCDSSTDERSFFVSIWIQKF